ncbi:uncharacterized protein LOC124144153 isoform X3 [Haliotis rufescens]|uniref:uncharacterized protein LOC124144153 isoform X3 n=1 Tax=Haliotis rufescens TaxID=6454 RepID=UPI001EAFAD93|nr:uncharacterized protein LOC124144153 isoform X3 [Haliotis rufescens]
MGEKEEIVMTAMKKNGRAMMRLERKKKEDINFNNIHHIAGGPYKGILVSKTADELESVQPSEGRVEFMAYLFVKNEGHREPVQDLWTLQFWFRGSADGVQKKKLFTDYFQELVAPGSLSKNYIGFVKRALVLLKNYRLIKRVELEVKQNEETEPDEDIPPVQSFTSVFTPSTYAYQFVPEVQVNNKHFLTFKIKAAGDAYLALSAVYGDVDRKTHEIVLGAEDNTKSFIRDGSMGAIRAQATTINLLSEDDFRFFWVSWKNHVIEVGRGAYYGKNTFLKYKLPQTKQFNINCMALSTGRASKGQWEFAEILDELPVWRTYTGNYDKERADKRAKIRMCLLWLAKKQRMLSCLEDAYPNPVPVAELLQKCKIKSTDCIAAVVMLNEMQRKGLIQEVEKDIWMRVQSGEQNAKHEIKLVKEMPTLTGKEQPTIGVITGLFCEKLAVDAMMEEKTTYVKFKTEGESQVYTCGRIGKNTVVSTKLSRLQGGQGAMIAAENTVTRLLGTFSRIDHVFIVGCGGAVPHYTDYTKHVRLGDVVVSMPVDSSGAMYVYCQKVERLQGSRGYSYMTRAWDARDQTLQTAVKDLRRTSEIRSHEPKPWELYVEEGKDKLKGEESKFHRPNITTDKLYATNRDGTVLRYDHPRPRSMYGSGYREGQMNVRYGVIGSGRIVARAEDLRQDFSQMNNVKAFDAEYDSVLESLEGNRCDSFLIIRGMCDYVDGQKKEWQPYASLTAAAYMKAVIMNL